MRKSGYKCTFSLYETSFEHDNLLSESLYLYNKPNTKTVEAGINSVFSSSEYSQSLPCLCCLVIIYFIHY